MALPAQYRSKEVEVRRRALVRLAELPEPTDRTFIVKMLLIVLCAYLFLWVPDLDFALLPLLHHRSIITHSILPGLLFLILGRRFGSAPAAGALIGLSVHLACDLLSPMVGYAQIWLPAPIKMPLGPVSYIWLAANAVVGFALASLIAARAFRRSVALPIVLIVSVVTGLTYGAFNEGSTSSIAVVVVTYGVSMAIAMRVDLGRTKSTAGDLSK